MDIRLLIDIVDVCPYGGLGNKKPLCNVGGRSAGDEVVEHFGLSLRQLALSCEGCQGSAFVEPQVAILADGAVVRDGNQGHAIAISKHESCSDQYDSHAKNSQGSNGDAPREKACGPAGEHPHGNGEPSYRHGSEE